MSIIPKNATISIPENIVCSRNIWKNSKFSRIEHCRVDWETEAIHSYLEQFENRLFVCNILSQVIDFIHNYNDQIVVA